MSEHAWLEMAAPYALDALAADEVAEFEAHMADCPECQRAVQEYREVAGMLALSAPTATPPSHLRERILSEARAVRPIGSARPQPSRTSRAPWMAAAAAVTLALFAGIAYWQVRSERDRLRDAYAQAQEGLRERDALLVARDSLLAALLGPELRTATLAATGRPPSARLFWNPQRRQLVIATFDLPPARAGRTYQLWGIAEGQPPISLGTFNTPPSGRGTIALPVPAGARLDLGAVTEEPAGGSPQPTSAPFLVGSWTD